MIHNWLLKSSKHGLNNGGYAAMLPYVRGKTAGSLRLAFARLVKLSVRSFISIMNDHVVNEPHYLVVHAKHEQRCLTTELLQNLSGLSTDYKN
jgi:hypothetical protein